MPRTTCLLLALAAVLVVAAPVRPTAQASSRVEDLLARHAAGVPNVLSTTFPDHFTFLDWRVELFTHARAWRESWHPSGTALLLELSFWGFRQNWPDAFLILRAAEDMVTGRAAAPGMVAAQDAFEITFHRAALAWLIGTRSLPKAHEYLQRVDARVVAAVGTGVAGGRLIDARLALARGVLDDASTAPGAQAAGEQGPASLAISAGDRERRAALDRALANLTAASALPAVSDEATVRRAFVLHRLGRPSEALTALAGLEERVADPVVRYWRHLFMGRVLEALDRPREAAASYRRAGETVSGAQTPAVALAALFQRQGDAVEARRWARIAGTTAAAVSDPWWQYWSGDLRFVPDWLSELREGQP